MPLTGPEPCPVRGEYHQWAVLERVPGGRAVGEGMAVSAVLGPDRVVVFCQLCLATGFLDELVKRG